MKLNMDEKTINSYLELIKIKTINSYYKYIAILLLSILVTGGLEFSIPSTIMENYSLLIETINILINYGGVALLISCNYKKNLKKFKQNNNVNYKTTVKECYEILKKEEIIKNDMPIESVVSRYYLDPESYYTEKGKKLIRKR